MYVDLISKFIFIYTRICIYTHDSMHFSLDMGSGFTKQLWKLKYWKLSRGPSTGRRQLRPTGHEEAGRSSISPKKTFPLHWGTGNIYYIIIIITVIVIVIVIVIIILIFTFIIIIQFPVNRRYDMACHGSPDSLRHFMTETTASWEEPGDTPPAPIVPKAGHVKDVF